MCNCLSNVSIEHIYNKCSCDNNGACAEILIAIIVGFIVALGIGLLFWYFNSKRKDERDIDRAMLGLPLNE